MSILKKQGVAWIITVVMIAAAIGIGQAKAPQTGPTFSTNNDSGYVYDDADVLSAGTVNKLTQINQQLWNDMDVVIAVVTCNYGGSSLFNYTLDYAEDIGLTGNDCIIVMDISGGECGMIQGAALVDDLTDDDCYDYVQSYMQADFDRGNYDKAVLSLAQALSDWYYDNY